MTHVCAKRIGSRCFISAKGHATGSVEVCAAVSGILYALGGYLANAEKGKEIVVFERRIEDADVVFDFDADAEARAAFKMGVIGLMQIAAEKREFLQVEYIEEEICKSQAE